MKKGILIMAIMVGFGLISCSDKASNENVETEEIVSHEDLHGEIDTNEGIELNNGDKWLINDEMRPHLSEAENTLKNYIEEGSSDYQKLASELEMLNADLINSCTMEGKGHDELHKWLHHHINHIENLKNSNDKEVVQNTINSLVDSFQEFHQYFN